jgi:aspartyl protease family protein
MTTDQTADVVRYGLLLVLVAASFLSRRLSLRSTFRMTLAWVAIFALVLVLFSFRQSFRFITDRVQAELTGTPIEHVEGRSMRIVIASDGHYWVDGGVNGLRTRFLIDSGASITALSEATADASGLMVDPQRIAVIETANGPVNAKHGVVQALSIGTIQVRNLPVVVSPAFGEINVLGMNVLSQLKSWRVENGEMRLEPR